LATARRRRRRAPASSAMRLAVRWSACLHTGRTVQTPAELDPHFYLGACPGCGVLTPEAGFGVDRSKSSGHKSRCKACDRRRSHAYYDAHKDEFCGQRQAIREAEREAALKALEPIHRKRVAEAKKLHAAQVRRQNRLLRELGVPDLSPKEFGERARPSSSRH
jgi:hypothetical protein